MNSKNIRKTFLDFFSSKGHDTVRSAPMVVKNDPTLMFTNAGMNQFKDYFLGNATPENPRIADTQKCLRVSGKHNDLEEVGVDTYHHTMFEMLGNWSFGNYFKKEAIDWAWELLTKVYGIETDKIYVTVFAGDEQDNLPKDGESINFWKQHIEEDRILQFGKKDNFWEMGDTGPCGPCSEIHVDIRSDAERKTIDGKTLVNKSHPQVIEIWNLVFIQFERKANGNLHNLPAKHIDTGMGFERLCMVLQHKTSNYDTDVFQPLIKKIEEITGRTYLGSEVAMRVISDHIRAISFSIADGQLPSNTGAGYVIRRILRRAVRYGYSFLKMEVPFIYKLVPVLGEQMGEFFPELNAQKEFIEKVIREEEESFLRTLERGIARFNEFVTSADSTNGAVANISAKKIPGKFAFELYDTYGFPLDLTELLAREKNMQADVSGFNEEMQKQKKRSRAATAIDTGDWINISSGSEGVFTGYDSLEEKIKITRYRKIKVKGNEQFQLVFDKTPFYAESGGQVGDMGFIFPLFFEEGKNAASEKIVITGTRKENNLIIHFTDKLPSTLEDEFIARVDEQKRFSTMNNHSATHLLHEALRKILGTHVHQKGSLVNAGYLRFDFSHFQKMTEKELEKVENFVNEKIRANIALDEKREVPVADAKNMGAMALFGEKYGDKVRVIRFGSSVELCGGTHVKSTGQIGFFKIISESAIAAGVRRIEAITGEKAQQFINDQLKTLTHIKALLKNPKDIEKSISDLLSTNAELSKKTDTLLIEKVKAIKNEFIQKKRKIEDVNFLAEKTELEPVAIKNLAFQLKSEVENLFLVLANESNGKANLTVAISDNLVKEKNLNASIIVRELAKEIQGSGGGQPNYATAGGSNVSGIENALKKAEKMIPGTIINEYGIC